MRDLWKLPLGLLLALLAVIVAVANVQLGGLTNAIHLPAPKLSPVPDEWPAQKAINEAVEIEQRRSQQVAALRTALAGFEVVLKGAVKTGNNAPQSPLVVQLRHAVDKLGLACALFLSGGNSREQDALKAAVGEFRSELAVARSKPLTPRDRAIVDDLEKRFNALAATVEALCQAGSERTANLLELKALRKEPPQKMENIQRLPGITKSAVAPTREAVLKSQVQSSIAQTRWLLIALTCTAMGCAITAVMFASRKNARPIAYLVDLARAVTHGRVRERADPEKAGELAEVAQAFNQMIEAQQQAEERLRKAHDSLELKVSARTAELWRANKALLAESEQRALAEREFQQAQKMDALGKLAGSIAHDFNNLLTVIIGGAECVRKQLGPGHASSAMLSTVEKAGERAAALTRPLLTFSRSQVLALEVVDINEAVEEAGRMLHRLLGVNIELKLELSEDVLRVRANANQLQQVLINLGVNARDAMDGTGVLTIITRNLMLDGQAPDMPEGELWVELAVRDTGCGMDAATKARIFEPFFTTKPAGRGTGLGLATVFGIVKQTSGFMEVESALGEGTTFRVFLPATHAAEVHIPVSTLLSHPHTASPGGETLLLVDDEEELRELATLNLEALGYRIISAANAEEAIILGLEHASEIRALVTDVIMPGMTGVQLAGVLSTIIPDLGVLFVSGHSNETISEEMPMAAHAAYLQKPYLSAALATKVQEVLTNKL